MKISPFRIALVFGLASLAFAFLGCPKKENLDGKEGKHGLAILPDVQHPEFEAHWNAINDILQKASSTRGVKRTELFRIREYKGGEQVGEEKGELDDELLVVDVERLNTKARENKFDGHAMQIGVGLANDFRVMCAESPTPTPSPEPRPAHSAAGMLMPQSHLRLKIAESENVMNEVDKELDKTPTPTPSPTVVP